MMFKLCILPCMRERKSKPYRSHKFLHKRILKQIQTDGSMPEEMARTRPLFYSIYNLNALFLVAHLAEKVGVDIWKTNDPSSRLRIARLFSSLRQSRQILAKPYP